MIRSTLSSLMDLSFFIESPSKNLCFVELVQNVDEVKISPFISKSIIFRTKIRHLDFSAPHSRSNGRLLLLIPKSAQMHSYG